MSELSADPANHPQRRRSRRRFAAWIGLTAVVLLAGGLALANGASGMLHTVGVGAFGYGIGAGVAALFLASGWEPRRHGHREG